MGTRRTNRMYRIIIESKEWRELRAKHLRKHPLCERCLAAGIYTTAAEVHHLRPVEWGRTFDGMRRLAYDPNNLQSVCRPCHILAHKELGRERYDKKALAERARKDATEFVARFLGGE